MKKILCFDTETTGLIRCTLQPLKKQPRVIEFYGGVLDTDTYTVGDELDFLCQPEMKISEEITKITNITNDMLVDAEPFSFYAKKVKDLIENSDAVLAHNLEYDYNIINFEMERAGLKVEWPKRICTVEQTEWFEGYRLSLTKLHERLFGKPFDGAHRARQDVEALIKCVIELHKQETF